MTKIVPTCRNCRHAAKAGVGCTHPKGAVSCLRLPGTFLYFEHKDSVVLGPAVDSKVAAGAKKSAPFLFALAEVWVQVREYDQSSSPDHDGIFFSSWMDRRQGLVRKGDHRVLAYTAHAAIRLLVGDLELAPGEDPVIAAFREIWKVSMFGEGKHGANNWMSAEPGGMWHYEAAMWRHWIERHGGELRAEDSKCYHYAHMAWGALMLLEMECRGVVNPDWAIAEAA